METEWVGRVAAAEYLQADERALRAGRGLVRAGIFADISVSVGVAVRLPVETETLCTQRGWPVLRRSSGGSGLLHRPGDLVWSVVLPRGDPRVGPSFVRSYGRFGAPIVAALREAGVDARWAPAFGLSDQFCLFGGRGEVLAVDDRALGGAAQHLTRTAFLHHGVVGGRLDRSALAELFDVASEPLQQRLTSFEERGGSDTLDRVGRRSLEAWAKDPEGGNADVSPSRSA